MTLRPLARPNAEWHHDGPRLRVRSLVVLAPGEEVSISYLDLALPPPARPRAVTSIPCNALRSTPYTDIILNERQRPAGK